MYNRDRSKSPPVDLDLSLIITLSSYLFVCEPGIIVFFHVYSPAMNKAELREHALHDFVVAMGVHAKALESVADIVADTVENDGILKVLEKNGMI